MFAIPVNGQCSTRFEIKSSREKNLCVDNGATIAWRVCASKISTHANDADESSMLRESPTRFAGRVIRLVRGILHRARRRAPRGVASQRGFSKRGVIRSLSPIASYFAWSKFGSAGLPLGADSRVGGSVHTPNG